MGQAKRGELERAARQLGVTSTILREQGWKTASPARVRAAREADDKLRRELADALVTSVHEVWFQELKHAVTGADAAAVDARWAPKVRRGARQLAGELSAGQVRARIAWERDASDAAASYRASQLLWRAPGG